MTVATDMSLFCRELADMQDTIKSSHSDNDLAACCRRQSVSLAIKIGIHSGSFDCLATYFIILLVCCLEETKSEKDGVVTSENEFGVSTQHYPASFFSFRLITCPPLLLPFFQPSLLNKYTFFPTFLSSHPQHCFWTSDYHHWPNNFSASFLSLSHGVHPLEKQQFESVSADHLLRRRPRNLPEHKVSALSATFPITDFPLNQAEDTLS